MSARSRLVAVLAVSLTVGATVVSAQEEMTAETMSAVSAADLTFSPIEVPGFLSGMQIAIVHGDPSVADAPYTLRLLFPDGYAFPPHWHPRTENVTVLEGSFQLAMGDAFDEDALVTYAPGDYLYIEGEHPHFGKATGRTMIQLHGVGPFDISVVEGQEMGQ